MRLPLAFIEFLFKFLFLGELGQNNSLTLNLDKMLASQRQTFGIE